MQIHDRLQQVASHLHESACQGPKDCLDWGAREVGHQVVVGVVIGNWESSPPVNIIQPHDVVLAEIGAGLHLN